jgi:hypothetical protein
LKQKKKQIARKKSNNIWLLIIGLAVLGGVAWYWFTPSKAPVVDTAAREAAARIPTLSPDLFTGKTRDAYQAARDIPEILDKVPCYCGCMQNSGHRSNLFCFTDQHGVT